MPTTIKLKNSVTTTNAPSSLAQGEVAINVTDKKVWVGNAATTPVQIVGTGAGGGAAAGSNTQVQYNSSGALAGDADFTFNGTTVTMANDASISGLTVGKGGGALVGNTAFGLSSLLSNTSGLYNTSIGRTSSYANTTGSANSALGMSSLEANTTGNNNTALGYASLFSNTTASNNTAVGYQALYANTTASNNTAVGHEAGYSNTTGAYNTFVGTSAGYASNYNGNAFNTCVGYNSGTSLTTGIKNTFIGGGGGGNASGAIMTTGSANTIVGNYNGNNGGLDIRTASNYIVLSDGDGNPRGIFDSSGNLLIGQTARGNVNSNSFNLDLSSANFYCNHGSGVASGTAYTTFAYAGTQIGSIVQSGTTAVAYNTSSDYRLKENIAPMQNALNVVQQLKPVTYNWKSDGSNGQGFIAHELQAVVPDCVTGEKDAVDAEGNPQYQGIDTSFLVATLTAAIQELKAEFDAYKATHP